MDLRREAIELAAEPQANVSEVACRFGISRKTLYKWMSRWSEEGQGGLVDRSRRPHSSPGQTQTPIERAVVKLRQEHPAWGGRKISRVLKKRGCKNVPAPSTVTGILRRHGLIESLPTAGGKPWERFERSEPNDLVQMDFKGHFGLNNGRRCHPLTMLDDHSRYCLAVRALPNERGSLVAKELVRVFETYGLPRQILTDNGSPWGDDSESRHTKLTVWLVEHGVSVIHGRPMHPQTQGKEERFHRTLKAEVIAGRAYRDLADTQEAFDRWRPIYNHERPHDALGLEVPSSRYRVSCRSFQGAPTPWEYAPGVFVRKVDADGRLSFQGISWKIGRPFVGRRVGIQPTTDHRIFEVYFRHQWIAYLDMNED